MMINSCLKQFKDFVFMNSLLFQKQCLHLITILDNHNLDKVHDMLFLLYAHLFQGKIAERCENHWTMK